jgi:hypothetical protein
LRIAINGRKKAKLTFDLIEIFLTGKKGEVHG